MVTTNEAALAARNTATFDSCPLLGDRVLLSDIAATLGCTKEEVFAALRPTNACGRIDLNSYSDRARVKASEVSHMGVATFHAVRVNKLSLLSYDAEEARKERRIAYMMRELGYTREQAERLYY